MKRFELKPLVRNEAPLVFDWDVATGEVSGPDAARVLEMAKWPSVSAHPVPWAWDLGPEPTKSLTDMAAILGWSHDLPDELAAHYPRPEGDEIEATAMGADGSEHPVELVR
ncbi:MAG: hypothetical protein IPK27_15030 [Rhodanobacteraceae bacterium]|nr:hypothetical protein [Rhodanobacteraceae bacterium]